MIIPPIPPQWKNIAFEALLELGKKAVGKLVNKVGEWIENIFSSGDNESKNIASQNSYDKDNASINETTQIIALLRELKNELIASSEILEDSLVLQSEEFLDEIRDLLDNMSINSYNIEKINRQNQHKISEIFKKEIMANISLDNDKCVQILRMSAGDEKQNAIKNFKNSIIITALEKIKKELKSSFDDVLKNFKEAIQNKLDLQDISIKSKIKSMEQIRQSTSLDKKQAIQMDLESKMFFIEQAKANLPKMRD